MESPESNTPKEGSRPDKSRIIRNREVDKAATALAEEHTLPLPPGKSLSWEQAQEYLNLLTPPMWGHVSAYLYRLRPKIRRQLKNPEAPNYIDCLGEPFTMEYLIGRHGGGRYMLQVNDTDNKVQLFKCQIDINEIQYPPILEFEELELEARENQSYITWLRNQGILDAKGNVMQHNPAAGNNNSADIVKEVLNFVKQERPPQTRSDDESLGKAVGTILVERIKQDDPAKQIETVTNLLTALKDDPTKQLQVMTGCLNVLKEMRSDSSATALYDKLLAMQADHNKTVLALMDKPADNSTTAVYDKLLAMQADHNKTVLGLMDKIFQTQNPPQHTPMDDFDKVFNLIDRAASWRGSGGRRSGWDIGYDFARDIGLPFVQTIGNMITNGMALRRNSSLPAAGTAPGPNLPASFDPYANPGAARAYASNLAGQQPPAPPAAPTPPPNPQNPPPAAAPADQLAALFQQYGNLVIGALNGNQPGHYFAENLVGLMGTGIHAMICGHGEDTLVQNMLAFPEFQIFGEPRLRRFAHEFTHYEELLAQENEEEEEAMEPDEIDTSNVYRPPQRPSRSSHRPQ